MSQSSGASAPVDLRCVRALAVAGVAVLLGVTGHVTAGGLVPGWGVVVPLVTMLAVVSAMLLGGPASYRRLVALVAGGQAAIHLVLTMVSGHAGDHAPDAGAGALPHALQHLRDDLTGPHLLMAVGHLAAAAGVAGWLLLGERAVWWLLALLGRHVWPRQVADWWLTRPVATPRAGRSTWHAALTRVGRAAATGPVGRRGPPRRLLATNTALPA